MIETNYKILTNFSRTNLPMFRNMYVNVVTNTEELKNNAVSYNIYVTTSHSLALLVLSTTNKL